MQKEKEVYDPVILSTVIKCLKESIKDKKINIVNYTIVIISTMEIIEKYKDLNGNLKKKYLIMAIEDIAKGDDGIVGTADDLISKENVVILKNLIDQNILSDLIDIISDASKGLFDINKTSKTLKNGCKILCF